jgi:hypothetical protein
LHHLSFQIPERKIQKLMTAWFRESPRLNTLGALEPVNAPCTARAKSLKAHIGNLSLS